MQSAMMNGGARRRHVATPGVGWGRGKERMEGWFCVHPCAHLRSCKEIPLGIPSPLPRRAVEAGLCLRNSRLKEFYAFDLGAEKYRKGYQQGRDGQPSLFPSVLLHVSVQPNTFLNKQLTALVKGYISPLIDFHFMQTSIVDFDCLKASLLRCKSL